MSSPHADALRFLAHVLPRLAVSATLLAWGAGGAYRAARARLGAARDEAILAAAVGLALALTVPALLLGAVGWLRDWTWALLALPALAWIGRTPRVAAIAPPDPAPPSRAFAIAVGGFALGRLVFSLRNTPADWDSFHYHLPMIAGWLATGTLGVPMHEPPAFGQFFPGGGELLEAWAAWSTGRETLLPWVGIAGLVLLALAQRRLALRAGAGPRVAEAMALVVAAAPGIVQLTIGAKVDHLLAAWFAVALLFALRVRERGEPADLAVLIGAAGLMPGVKTTGPLYALVALAIAFAGRGGAARLRLLAACGGTLAAALLAGGFWYVRNALATGNPLFPGAIDLGPVHAPGLMTTAQLRGTTQLAVWATRGNAGHTTPARLLRFFGPGFVALDAGFALAAVRAALGRGARAAAPFAVLAVVLAVLYAATPFSGVYWPAVAGEPLRTNFDNLRLLLPALVLAGPVAAAGLSFAGADTTIATVLAALWLVGLGRKCLHVVPGIALVAFADWLARSLRRGAGHVEVPVRLALGAAAVLAVGLTVALVEPTRETLMASAWNAYASGTPNLPWEEWRSLRERAHGRPLGIVGPVSVWAAYGRDFSGRPVYVPVEESWRETSRPFHLAPEPRTAPDRERWLDNLAASRAAAMVVSRTPDLIELDVRELAWCAADTAHFTRLDTLSNATAYAVRAAGPR